MFGIHGFNFFFNFNNLKIWVGSNENHLRNANPAGVSMS